MTRSETIKKKSFGKIVIRIPKIKLTNQDIINLFRYLAAFLVLLPFFPPEGLGFTGLANMLLWIKRLQSLETLALFLYECYFFVIHLTEIKGKYRKRFLMFGLVILLSFLQIFSTWRGGGHMPTALERIYVLMGAYVICDIFMHHTALRSFRVLTAVFAAVAAVNFAVVLLKYDTMGFREQGDYWLFGQKNAIRNIVIPSIAFSSILDRINKKKYSLLTLFLTVTGVAVLILVDSSTSIAIIALFAALLLYLNVSNFELLNLKMISVIYLVLEVVIVFMRRIDIFSQIIEGTLNRDVTLTNRTLIWDAAMKVIRQHPIFGDGLRALENSRLTMEGFKASHAHNALLDITLKCGIVGAAVLVTIVVLCMIQQFKMRQSSLGAILGMTLGAFLIAGIVGELWNFGFYTILFTMYYLPEITQQVEFGNVYAQKRSVRLKFRA